MAFPGLMKPLLGVSGLSVVALDEGDRRDDAVARLLNDLTRQLREAGVTVSPQPSLEATLRATLPLWASFVGDIRDSALCGFMLTLAAKPDVEAWQIALDPEQAKDTMPKLILIDATTTPRILQSPKTQRAELDRIRQSLAEWRPVRAELVNYTKSGEEFWLELDIVPLADETGRFTHWVSVERDITERHRADERLRISEARFRLVSKATGNAIWEWDIAGRRR